MKKTAVCILLAILLSVLSPVSFAEADSSNNYKQSVFIMPATLEAVEDEAFEGTAVESIVFQDGIVSIGDSTFERAYNLTDVYIPPTIEYIGKNAFPRIRD